MYAAVFNGEILATSFDMIEIYFLATKRLIEQQIFINPFEVDIMGAASYVFPSQLSQWTLIDGVIE